MAKKQVKKYTEVQVGVYYNGDIFGFSEKRFKFKTYEDALKFVLDVKKGKSKQKFKLLSHFEIAGYNEYWD